MAAVAALLGAGAAQAQESVEAIHFKRDFCRGLKQLVEAAAEARRQPPAEAGRVFLDIYNRRSATSWFGFRPGACRASAGTEKYPASYWCHQHLAPLHLSLESLSRETAACYPEAKAERDRWGRGATFTLPDARIQIGESGGPRAKVGRIVRLTVEAIPSN
jgi:hypothetical protein